MLIVPDEMKKMAKEHTGPALFATPAPLITYTGSFSSSLCPHCDQTGQQRLRLLHSPTETMERGKRQIFYDGKWWEFNEHVWPCPGCNAKNERQARECEKDCGLQPEDFDIDLFRYAADPEKADAIRAAADIVEKLPNVSGWISLFGGYGVGKSTVAKCIVAAAVKRGVRARFVQASDLLDELAATVDYEDIAMIDLIAKYVDVYRVLAVDEVMEIGDRENAHRRLRAILNRRYEKRRSCLTILTTNADPLRMPANFGYLDSRMTDGLRFIMAGDDLRKK